MHPVIIIPARYESSRFPGKPLVDLCGKSLIRRVWDTCSLVTDSYVATDDQRIQTHCQNQDIPVIMTGSNCKTGTDRVFEASKHVEHDFVINVQGDEPLVRPKDIEKVIEAYESDPKCVYCGMSPIGVEDFHSTSVPKIVTKLDGEIIYISRAPIPSSKDMSFKWAFRQVCIYAFSLEDLERFGKMPRTPIEMVEDIEILRFMEMGQKVWSVKIPGPSIAIDYPEDADRVRRVLQDMGV